MDLVLGISSSAWETLLTLAASLPVMPIRSRSTRPAAALPRASLTCRDTPHLTEASMASTRLMVPANRSSSGSDNRRSALRARAAAEDSTRPQAA